MNLTLLSSKASYSTSFSFSGNYRKIAGLLAKSGSFSTSFQTTFNPLGSCKLSRTFRSVFPNHISKSRPSLFSTTISANMSFPSKVVEHIVFFKVKEGTPPEKANAMVTHLQGLRSLNTVLQLSVGPASHVNSESYQFTHALHSRYKDKESLADYSNCTEHVNVVKEFVLPIVDDILALDWEAELEGPSVASYGALRVAVLKPKDNLTETLQFELVEILSAYKSIFPLIEQVSFGENFSPARAKGFKWGFLSFFPGVKELQEFDTDEENIKLQQEKVLPRMENFIVIDMINLANTANL